MNAQPSGGVHLPVLDYLGRSRDRPCFYFEDATLSYGEVLDSIYRISRALLASGVRPGDGVAILADNSPEVFCARTAAQLLGARATALHALGAVHEHRYVLTDAGIDVIVFDPKYGNLVTELADRVKLRVVAALGTADPGFDLLEAAAAQAVGPPQIGPVEQPHALVYSGGTTGEPKGIIMSPAAQAFAAATMKQHWQWPQDVCILLSTPLGHAAGTLLLPTFARGGSVVLMPSFKPDEWLRAVERHRVTAALLVPTQIYRLLDDPLLARADVSSIETIFYGASPCSPTRLAEAIGIFGPVFFQFYGQTEAPMTVAVLRKEEHDLTVPGRLSSCGRPVPGVEVSLLDDDGDPVPPGAPGEICVRGPLVALESYKNRPAETAVALAGGWLHTGDVATRDEDGFLHIVDRKKDMIVTGGLNVYPRPIEDCLITHPSVRTAIVIGVPDDRWGEAVKAIVVRHRDHADVSGTELIRHVRNELGGLHAPKVIEFVDTVALSPLGKPDRQALRAAHWGGRARLVN